MAEEISVTSAGRCRHHSPLLCLSLSLTHTLTHSLPPSNFFYTPLILAVHSLSHSYLHQLPLFFLISYPLPFFSLFPPRLCLSLTCSHSSFGVRWPCYFHFRRLNSFHRRCCLLSSLLVRTKNSSRQVIHDVWLCICTVNLLLSSESMRRRLHMSYSTLDDDDEGGQHVLLPLLTTCCYKPQRTRTAGNNTTATTSTTDH